jgi:katanin p60 ATPase-containing subunit A1
MRKPGKSYALTVRKILSSVCDLLFFQEGTSPCRFKTQTSNFELISMSLLAIKASSDANSAEQKRQQDRKKNILVLINHFLIENGYFETAERLNNETNSVVTKFAAADNVDLTSILIDYEAYYEIRFDKKPKLIRKLTDGEDLSLKPSRPPVSGKSSSSSGSSSASSKTKKTENNEGTKLPPIVNAPESNEKEAKNEIFSVTGTTFKGNTNTSNNSDNEKGGKQELEEKFLKPPPNFFGDSELKQLANVISREIYQESPNVRFADIIHLDEAKRLLMEAVQLPLRFPTLFTGILRPWRGILLHGPPGTGNLPFFFVSLCFPLFLL